MEKPISKEEKQKKKYLKSFGQNLRKIRKEKGLSQHELAYRSDIDKNQIGNIERGERNATTYTLYRIITALQIEPDKLFSFDETNESR